MNSKNKRHKKFISEFVGALYAILIGLGIANVNYTLDLSIANWFHFVLALFVTVIVALYWWDWAAYVDEQYVATPSEFAIDFAGLIVLEFLFVHYLQPAKLAATFLALGIVDLCWVVNHIRQSPDQTLTLRKWWLAQKLLGLAIYGMGLSCVLWLQPTGGLVQQGGCVMLAAVLVRSLCFREMRRKCPFTFRPARLGDLADILAINQAYLEKSFSDAFLLNEVTSASLGTLVDEHPQRLFVVSKGDAALAYAIVAWAIDEDTLSSLIWLDPQLECSVRSGGILHIEQVAVASSHAGQGIGKSFYRWLVEQHPSLLPCAFVAQKPRCNTTSLRFHAAMGFEKAAVYRSESFLGHRNYQSLLYVFTAGSSIAVRQEAVSQESWRQG